MGFAVTWCAVRTEGAALFLRQLGLTATGQTEAFPESPVSVAELDTGWSVLWYNAYGCPFLQAKDLATLSRGRDVILCLVEEHVMASSSELWSDGRRRWCLSHEGENGPQGLAIQGDLPASFPEIRKQMEASQLAAGGDEADVDYIFEIPLKVAQSHVGFKHDEDCPHIVHGHFTVLSRDRPGKGFWGRLFSP